MGNKIKMQPLNDLWRTQQFYSLLAHMDASVKTAASLHKRFSEWQLCKLSKYATITCILFIHYAQREHCTTHNVLAYVSNGFKWRLFQHLSRVGIGDISCQHSHHLRPWAFRQFSACNICNTLCGCARHHLLATQRFQNLQHYLSELYIFYHITASTKVNDVN